MLDISLHVCAAVGCANIDIPSGMWMRREGDNLLVRCNQTEEIWYLTCENEAWKGRIGNCSAGETRGDACWIMCECLVVFVQIVCKCIKMQ